MKTAADLYGFQREAVDYLASQQSSILADDMGLGKTVTAMELDRERRRRQVAKRINNVPLRTLVLCPLSVIASWEEHFAEWQPDLRVCVIDNKDRLPFVQALQQWSYDVYIVHWDVIRLMPELAKPFWFHIIADEAHRVANKDAQVTHRAKKLKWHFLTELTGTPCTTRPEQFWSLLNWAKPRVFTSFNRFYNYHVRHQKHDSTGECQAIVGPQLRCGKAHQTSFKVILGIEHAHELLDAIKPYYLRRLKEEVLKELPEKYYTKVSVTLGPQQRKVYNQMRDDMLAWIGENEQQPLAAPAVIAKLIRLQQLACAYALITTEKKKKRHEHSIKCSGATWDPDARQYVGGDATICTETWDEIEVRKVTLIDPSAKLDATMDILNANPDKQFVVFSQSKQVINLLGARLAKAGISHGLFTGDTSQVDRKAILEGFQAGRIRVFAGTIAAGGEGITLTASSTTIFIDRSWSPAKNNQAEDREHRIGQKNAVQIIDIVAKDTIDLGRLQRIENSWQWIKLLLGDKNAKTKPEGAYI